MKTFASSLVLCACIAGCANPGIVQISPDTYMLSRADRAGYFGNPAALKAGVIQDANEFAASKGKVAIPLQTNETPVRPGVLATFEYQFRVVDAKDPEARRTSIVPRPNFVIESTEKKSIDIQSKDTTPRAKDIYAELLRLDDLRKRGILTEAEFEAQKRRLLAEQ